MAIDQVLLEEQASSINAPSEYEAALRLYSFKPSAISIGQNQKLSDCVLKKIRNSGLDIVRRPTGGRAVLHQGEITYAFVAKTNCPDTESTFSLSGSILEVYKQICQGLIYAFANLGLNVSLGSKSARQAQLADCFAVATGADLEYQGLKIAGSAQLRRHNCVLQHGSILLEPRQYDLQALLSDSDSEPRALSKSTPYQTDIFTAKGSIPCLEELQESMLKGFEAAFPLKFEQAPLTEMEMSLANELGSKIQTA